MEKNTTHEKSQKPKGREIIAPPSDYQSITQADRGRSLTNTSQITPFDLLHCSAAAFRVTVVTFIGFFQAQ